MVKRQPNHHEWTGGARMQGIFVSYRRQDSQSAAGRLSDHLRDHLTGVPIFRDVETIEPGVDFVEAIERALSNCGVLVAVIGPRWLDAVDAEGRRRLAHPDDYTRIEIATALKRDGVRVIPVLVEGAQMPASDALPDDLASLARRNAIELTDRRWEYDVSQLVDTLRKVLDLAPPEPTPEPEPPPAPAARGGWVKWAVIGVLGLGVIGWLAEAPGDYVIRSEPGQSTDLVIRPAAEVADPVALVDLSGHWRDEEGGQFELVQRGTRFDVRGMTPDGPVEGRGEVQGQRGQTVYWLNGAEMHASFTILDNGNRLEASVVDPHSGTRERAVLYRLR
ncbi:toll/interleukin-1 receptor domain-containing protein [Denitromonas iodatirespirans]|uniref:Toll/interleukin-1 receptor domain-containing protein n=1 Tax=Denitromonas iodatirespirans TaxID=2795389 RepID=A0A944H9Q4_DENI1|nr:toll/interleukin-1 receptor domain-containing protein [Denitromonas iodatirespirans]MBT0963683.1 toll/interleukin-1 receptor domain-containing protein [Denitromonas iodatirespirans]